MKGNYIMDDKSGKAPFFIDLCENGDMKQPTYREEAESTHFKEASEIPAEAARELIGSQCCAASKDKQQKSADITAAGIEIGHANEVLKKAKALVCEAYALVSSDDIAKKHLEFSALVSWSKPAWSKLNEAYAKQNPDSKEASHWRAFEHFGLEIGMTINGAPETGS